MIYNKVKDFAGLTKSIFFLPSLSHRPSLTSSPSSLEGVSTIDIISIFDWSNILWPFAVFLFLRGLEERRILEQIDRKEMAIGTIRNYLKSIKLFCDMADLQIPWAKIASGLPSAA